MEMNKYINRQNQIKYLTYVFSNSRKGNPLKTKRINVSKVNLYVSVYFIQIMKKDSRTNTKDIVLKTDLSLSSRTV